MARREGNGVAGARVAAVLLLCALVQSAGMAADWTAARLVTVIETDYSFEPADLRFRAKTPYRLHLENRGAERHDFTAPEFFQTVELRNPDALEREQTSIGLQPGEQKDVYFVPRQSGRYTLRCADHDWAGMTGTIVVE